jgi:uncharacterized protein YacL
MQLSLTFIRILFVSLSVLLAITFAVAGASADEFLLRTAVGAVSGLVIGVLMMCLDVLFRRFNLRTFNTAILGLFFGYWMGSAILLIFQAALDIGVTPLESQTLLAIQAATFLIACYLGLVMTARASHELHVSIPFIQFKTSNQAKKDVLLDSSALADPRTIDLAASGLLDQSLIIPQFLLKDIQEQAESNDETIRIKARRKLETIKKLETLPSLELRYVDNNFTEIHDLSAKLTRLARQLDAYILTADTSKSQTTLEGTRIININTLSNALKPLAQNGESLHIKIQRYGKEPRQGVGYLDDGTMVVVNGGADYIGATIRVQVLSVKHTSSGRMIFCNTADNEYYPETLTTNHVNQQVSHDFALEPGLR